MANFCSNCGSPLDGGAKFCPKCGNRISAPSAEERRDDPRLRPEPPRAAGGAVRQGIPAPGFSDRVNHPEIIAAVKKNRKAAWIFMLFLVPLPFIGFVIYGIVDDKMSVGAAALIGIVISAVFLVFALIGLIGDRSKKAYEATVIEKRSQQTYGNKTSDGSRETITEYITVVRTTDGRTKKIVEREGSMIQAYYYLEVGDRFRYHPRFNFPYELYDKSKSRYIACVSCGTRNQIESDRCKKCGLPLLK